MIIRQIECQLDNKHTVAWTDADTMLKAGNFIVFKGDTERWKITKVHEPIMDSGELKRNWHVGGL